ncbi:MAG TPA: ATP-binding protein, partial [Kofleriaceae bacterium]|nr:ATP-binding protein [Kofleriaceae bacterium]
REAEDRRARIRAERELRFSEERYRTGFELAPEALLAYDLDRRLILDANAKATELFQCSREDLRSSDLDGLSPHWQPDGRSSADAASHYIARALTGESPAFPWLFQAGGLLIPIEIRIINLAIVGRNLAQINIVDIRERLRADEIRRRSAELETQNRRIREASRLKSEFLANMSHELRTPLNAIIGFAELVFYGQVAPDSPEHHEFLGDILTSGRHLLQLINDILDLATIEAGKLELRPEPVAVASTIGEVAGVLRTLSLRKRIRVQVEADCSIEVVRIDPTRFKQVLYNYLSNALKFTPEGGSIVVRIGPESPDSFRLEVEDTGVGIAPDHIARLFVEFDQLDAAGGKPPGTGLGLALTRKIVEAQGGSVGVRSRLGHGSVFHAVLPRQTAGPAR